MFSAILLFCLFMRCNDLYLLTDLPPRSPTTLSFLSLVLIIGGLLIYTLGDKKKSMVGEMMDKKTIKQIIAREGLIFLSILVVSGIIMLMGLWLSSLPLDLLDKTFWENQRRVIGEAISVFGFISIYAGYPFYLLIRFIVWAVRTMREGR